MSTVRLPFDPARDGFSFRNHFEWSGSDLALLSARLRPVSAAAVGGAAAVAGTFGAVLGATDLGGALVRAVARRWPSFGLCGGMALAAV